ncbi:MAG: hypothetical protein ACLURP_01075 [Ruminococcus sp.]
MIKKSVLEPERLPIMMFRGFSQALAAAPLLGALIYLVYRKFYAGVVFQEHLLLLWLGDDSACLYGSPGYQYQCGNFTWYGRSVVHCPLRTATKDPMDLLYLFWAITTGITAGAGMYVLALLAAAIMIHDDRIVLSQTAERKNLYCGDPLYRRPGRG